MAPPPTNNPPHDLNCLTINELEHLAHERMDKQTRDYYNEGADSGSTLAENISAYKKYRIRPRVLRDISNIDTSTTVFNCRVNVPFGVAPTAMQCLAHDDGEAGTARACREMGVVMGLSSFSTTRLEDVARENGEGRPRVLQLYLFEDREHSRRLIRRAKRAGYKAVLLTVDTPVLGRRNLEIRNQFKLPGHLKVANFVKEDDEDEDENIKYDDDKDGTIGAKGEEGEDKPDKMEQKHRPDNSKRRKSSAGYLDGDKRVPPSGPITFHTHAANPTLNWEYDIPWLKEVAAPMEVWVKGIATAEDAILAVHHKCDGIIVSNHGGRQLDGALATLDALPEVAAAVQGKVPVHVDGGIRHGTDIFKALALGADFCWVGRPVLWGLAYKGEEGVKLCLKLLSDEIKLCMGLAGTRKVGDIAPEYLVKVDRSGFVSRL